MEFDQLRTFLAVIEHGSFTRAAEVLGISQSTVSFQIKALETAANARLLDRTRDRVQPTAQGRVLRRYAAQLVSLRAEALGRVGGDAEASAGHVTVAASTIPGEYLLPAALAELRSSYPTVSVTVTVSDSKRALASLVSQEAELALVGSKPHDRRIASEPFAHDEIIAVGPSKPPWATPEDTTELEGVPLVLRTEGSGTQAAVADVVARVRATAAAATIEVGSTEAAKQCVLAGLGIGFVSRVAVANELERGRIRVVPIDGMPVRRTFHIARLRSTTLSPVASVLADLLQG